MTRSAAQQLHAGSPRPERRGTHARPEAAARAGEAGVVAGQCLAIVQTCLAAVVARAGDARRHDDPEAIHQLRVAIRRLRAAIAILRRCSPSMQLMAINAQLRNFQQALGAAREWDVLIDQTIASMPKRKRSSRSMRRFIAAAEARRGEGHERARAALTSRGEAGFLPALRKDIAS